MICVLVLFQVSACTLEVFTGLALTELSKILEHNFVQLPALQPYLLARRVWVTNLFRLWSDFFCNFKACESCSSAAEPVLTDNAFVVSET